MQKFRTQFDFLMLITQVLQYWDPDSEADLQIVLTLT